MRIVRWRSAVTLAGLAAVAVSAPSIGQDPAVKAEMDIRVEAVASTSVALPSALPLGRVNADSDGESQTVRFSVTAPEGVDFVVEVDGGENAREGQRRMRREGGGGFLPYVLVDPNSGRQVGSGDRDVGFFGGQPLGPFPGGEPQTVRFTADNFPRGVPPGRYRDTVTMTLVIAE